MLKLVVISKETRGLWKAQVIEPDPKVKGMAWNVTDTMHATNERTLRDWAAECHAGFPIYKIDTEVSAKE